MFCVGSLEVEEIQTQAIAGIAEQLSAVHWSLFAHSTFNLTTSYG